MPIDAEIRRGLREAFGRPVELTRVERFRLESAPGEFFQWSVARCHIADPDQSMPANVVVKWLRADPGGRRVDPGQMRTERAALELVAEVAPGIAPRLLAATPDSRLLVLEDLSPRRPLFDLLDGREDDAARTGLRAFATATGRLAAVMVDHHQAFAQRVTPRPGAGVFARQWRATREVAAAFGVETDAQAESEVATILEELTDPGPFLGFSNGDAGENNYLVAGDDGRIIDFEFAVYHHALLDAAWLHNPGPRWVAFPSQVASGLEDVFRAALVAGFPVAADDRRFSHAMGTAVLGMAIERCGVRLTKVHARPPGDPSRPQAITTFEYAARAAEHHRVFPHLAGWCRGFGAALRVRWRDADCILDDLERSRPEEWVRRGTASGLQAPASTKVAQPAPRGRDRHAERQKR